MLADVFLDTNILVYAAYPKADESWKQEIALHLIATERFAISAQVMLEFLSSTTRKRKPGLPLDQAKEWLADFRTSPVIAVDDELVMEGIALAERYRIVFWDGAILAAAKRSGARTLLTEDLSDGQRYGGVSVVNPFRARPN